MASNYDKLLEVLKQAEPDTVDYSGRFTQREMYPTKDVEDEEALLKIGVADLFTLGNFSAVVGKAKSRKSFLLSMLVAAYARGGLLYSTIESVKPGQTVIFDTEQGGVHLRQKLIAIEKMAGTFTKVRAYGLRPDPTKERIGFIDAYLKLYGAGTNLVVIDGVRDLISNINNPDESTEVVERLMKWTYDYNIHIVVVIHVNKEGGYARGHIGTEVMNKAETVIKVEKQGETTRVECEYSRGRPFNDFSFDIDDGIPIVVPNTFS